MRSAHWVFAVGSAALLFSSACVGSLPLELLDSHADEDGGGDDGTVGDADDGLLEDAADGIEISPECVEHGNFTPCSLPTEPDLSGDICSDGACVSPGSCDDAWCNPPGIRFRAAPDTMQRTCYDDSREIACLRAGSPETCGDVPFCGQDADYGWDTTHPAEARFGVGPGRPDQPVVRDVVTVLDWQGCVAGFSGTSCDSGAPDTPTWAEALGYCEVLEWGGFSDWRLPDPWEALSVMLSSADALLPSAFPAVDRALGTVWTSASVAGIPSEAYTAAMATLARDPEARPHFDGLHKAAGAMVRCVRDADVRPAWDLGARFTVQRSVPDEPLVLDSVTSLVWQGCLTGLRGSSCESGSLDPHTWREALSLCESLEWGGRTDWRLPNVEELFSIADLRDPPGALDETAFPNHGDRISWTATTDAATPDSALAVGPFSGVSVWTPLTIRKNDSTSVTVRCVAGGPAT